MMRTGILLINLGTPDSPNPRDVYRYLIEFLTDSRVIDIPWWRRQLLVRGIIVPSRYKISAAAYKKIWTEEGSPLFTYGLRLQKALSHALGPSYSIQLAMRYQNPSIELALESLLQKEISKLVIFPLFPQYASATTGSVQQKVMELLTQLQTVPEVTFIDSFFDQPAYIASICHIASRYSLAQYDRILFSFHGLPQRQLLKADRHQKCLTSRECCHVMTKKNRTCYAAQCYATARAVAEKLQIPQERYTICFQSRLGKEPWLEPFTSQVISQAAKNGERKLLVFCPSFVCDCLETLYEIGIEYQQEFIKEGGESLTLVEGLNDHPEWISALKEILEKKMGDKIEQEKAMATDKANTLISNEQLLQYNSQGLIPAPDESETAFLLRAKQCLQLEETLQKESKGLLPFPVDFELSQRVLSEALSLTQSLYDIEPKWLPLFFSNYRLTPWHGGCTWIFEMQEGGPKAAFLQLQKSLAKNESYLKIYHRNEVVAHEIAHVGRMAFEEKKFEELLAYRSSHSKLRRWLGPIVEAPWEGLLFIAFVSILTFVDLYLLFTKNFDSYAWAMQLKWIPIGMLLIGLARVGWRYWAYHRCVKSLRKVVDKPECVAYRLTDKEIMAFAKMSPAEILKYSWDKSLHSLRWRLIRLAYF